MLEIRDLVVYYDSIKALTGIDMEVKKGEAVVISGPNGAGKTTLLMSISGLLLYHAIKEKKRGGTNISILGSIKFESKNIMGMKPWEILKIGIALCPEGRKPFTELTVEENLKVGAYQNNSEMKERLEEVYSIFPELKEKKEQISGFLSGGEQQMLAIARALMSRPKLLMMDEPLMGLSVSVKQRLSKAFEELRDLGISLLITEQDVSPLVEVCERGYVIERGTISFSGDIVAITDKSRRAILA